MGIIFVKRKDLPTLKTNFVSPKEVDATFSSESETKVTSDSERARTGRSELEDDGVVYAHRNEDVVNVGPGTQGKMDSSILHNGSLNQPCIPTGRKSKLECGSGKENVSSINDQKRRQYSLLAWSVGMGELEFSKWLLSATPLEREKVLHDFKKRKKVPER